MKRLLVVAVLGIGCHHHDAAPAAAPGEAPPLPPASGTPIGYLLDARATLALRDDQVAKLHDLDESLAAQLDQIDATSRAASQPDPSQAPAPPHHHRGGGGRGAHVMGQPHAQHAAAPRAGGPSQARATQERATVVHDALAQALGVLDAAQKTTAREVLAHHDIDVDATSAPVEPAEPAETEPVPDEQ